MKKKSKRRLVIGMVIAAFIAAGIAIAYSNIDDGATSALPASIVVEPQQLDWGVVSARGGPVSQQFTVTNAGTGDLIIKKISTSCMCTTAVLRTAHGSTQRLGMDHGNLPTLREKIKPGESAILTVTFDPNIHYVRGPITRVVYIRSNDSARQEVEIMNRLTVID